MTAIVSFHKIKKAWQPSAGVFQVVFGALYELYLDESRAPDIRADLLPALRTYLHHCWPEKYPADDIDGMPFAVFTKYPESQKPELLRATEAFLHDFENDRVDPRLHYNRDSKSYFVSLLRELVDLMRRDMAAGP
jgi:hypothetical protein